LKRLLIGVSLRLRRRRGVDAGQERRIESAHKLWRPYVWPFPARFLRKLVVEATR